MPVPGRDYWILGETRANATPVSPERRLYLSKTGISTENRDDALLFYSEAEAGAKARTLHESWAPERCTSTSELPSLYFQVHLDRKRPEHTGAEGMFQVISITDDQSTDRTHLVDQGAFFHDLDELCAVLARIIGCKKDEVTLEEV